MLYLQILLFICLAVAMTGIFYQTAKTRFVQTKLKEAYNALDEAAAERTRREKRSQRFQNDDREKGIWERILETPSRNFTYSGLGRKIRGLTVEIWMLIILFSSAALYFFVYAVTGQVSVSLVSAGIYIFLILMAERLMMYRNYKIVDENLLHFLNQLGNFSVASGEITSVLHQISRYLPEPLNSLLEECYYDAQTSGDTSSALYALADKVQHEKFKEIINNIEICINYTSDFKIVVDNCRKSVMEEQRAKRERKAMAEESVLNMFILSILCAAALALANGLVDTSIWEILFHTPIGHGALFIIAGCYFVFFWKIATADR